MLINKVYQYIQGVSQKLDEAQEFLVWQVVVVRRCQKEQQFAETVAICCYQGGEKLTSTHGNRITVHITIEIIYNCLLIGIILR